MENEAVTAQLLFLMCPCTCLGVLVLPEEYWYWILPVLCLVRQQLLVYGSVNGSCVDTISTFLSTQQSLFSTVCC